MLKSVQQRGLFVSYVVSYEEETVAVGIGVF